MDTLFISDLHLCLERPQQLVQFKQLLAGPAREAKALYILGDLFEQFWVGNDDTTPPNQEVITELLDLTRHGTPVYIIKGNRELLLDKNFSVLSGATVLPDQAVIDLDGNRVLLMHGDLLCTQDHKYQRFRRFILNPLIRNLIRVLPYRLRIWLSHGLKPVMNRSVMQKPEIIMDVEQSAVLSVMRQHQVYELIHGHTHRPAIHEFELAGSRLRRIVLGDWYEDGRILVCNVQGKKMIPVSEYLRDYSGGTNSG